MAVDQVTTSCFRLRVNERNSAALQPRVDVFFFPRCYDGKLRWNQPDLYYFLTEIYVQSSAAAQRGTISEAGNLRRGFSAGAEGSTTTSLAQNSPRDG